MQIIATKHLTYGTRRLLPEEPFTATRRDARILVAIGKARMPSSVATPSEAVTKPKPKNKRRASKGEATNGAMD